MRSLFVIAILLGIAATIAAESPPSNLPIWPDLAPAETSRETGTTRPPREQTGPPVTRVENVRRPTIDVFPADKPNGVGVLILPGGGFNYVVTDKEGSDAAAILNRFGISAFVLRYRTRFEPDAPGWKRPLQDSQRALKYIRANAEQWKLDRNKIGLLGFSSGGQVAARLLAEETKLLYEPVDSIDSVPHRPDFSMLIYPWRIYAAETDSLLPDLKIGSKLPPTFIVHTHDDQSSSLGSALLYIELKKAGVDAELHVYENGGHGYGTRSKPHSNIGTWTDRMIDWLEVRQLARGGNGDNPSGPR
jgi:acetyl esterase/lipase